MNEISAKLPGLKLLLFKDGEEYVAHILDFDLVGTGATREEALKEVSDSATAQIAYALEYNRVKELLHPAPSEFYEKWKIAEQHALMDILISAKRPVRARKYEALELPASDLVPCMA